MLADPAGSPAVTEAPVETAAQVAAPIEETTQSSSSRLADVLQAEGFSEEETKEIVQPKGENDDGPENNSSAGSAGVSEKAGSGDAPAEGGAAAGEGDKQEAEAVAAKSEEEDEPLSDEHKADWPPAALERIHKATAKAKARLARAEAAETAKAELETEVATLRERVLTTAPVRVAPTAADPLADVTNVAELQGEIEHYESLLEFASLNPNGKEDVPVIDLATGKPKLDADGQPVTRDYSAEELAEMRFRAESILRKAVPNKARYLEARAAADKEAREVYPEIFAADPVTKKPTPEATMRQKLWEILPEMSRFEDPEVMIGHLIRGLKAHIADSAKATSARADKAVNGKQPSEELKPFLNQQRVKQAPHVPGTLGTAGGKAKAEETGLKRASERVLAGEGEAAEVDFITSLRGPGPGRRAALV